MLWLQVIESSENTNSELYTLKLNTLSQPIYSLLKKYKAHAIRLWMTGEGVNSPNGADDDDLDEYFDCYVLMSGPDATTTAKAQSIWGM